ncbi:glutamine phosphoribosylpyrophosphate amidotransferase [Petrocella atlantisensis]|uniref:Amidophosphoribosyltransferase n=1 Tax=Petrocella atlantisensis TaxID=2173034 RepID=A0A3P7NUA4_9FIRM|nr:amidophosphoribosyltransferase [Petrocella atlantisensis]VDN46455.1 glutamine phosphoribosylpyrophosphate amidotransferase [Petrocella atlantisensis]
MWQDKLQEECGVFGVYNNNEFDTSRMVYYGLFALQHRGQESAGIAVNNNGTIVYRKEMGMVADIFDDNVLDYLNGHSGIGHVRYSTTGSSLVENAQPLVIKYTKGHMALAHNGNLTNADTLRKELEAKGTIFQTTTDSEVIAALLSRARIKYNSIEEALVEVMSIIKGAYALVIMTPHKLIAARDPFGMRPLVMGKKEDSFVFSSESCAFDALGVDLVRDVDPGEIIVISKEKGLESIQTNKKKQSAMCSFEYIYFARPDSVIESLEVYEARFRAGKVLFEEHPVEADVIVGVPDSGLGAAHGFAAASGIPLVDGFMKNRYVGRTFIAPSQGLRELAVHLKLNPIRSQINGKRVIMIDDSIVRGTTSRRIVNLLREAGATEVHVRVSSPPVKYSCYFGIDTPERENLIASTHSLDEIRDLICADSVGYISREGLLSTFKGAGCEFCTGCFTGNYPVEIVDEEAKGCQ